MKLHFRDEDRYQAVNSSTEREKLFEQFQAELRHQQQEETKKKRQENLLLEERRRSVEAAKERATKETREKREKLEFETAKHDFLTLVGEKVRDPYAHRDWDRMRAKMEGDRRYRHRLLSRNEKYDLFESHISNLLRTRLEAFCTLLKTVDQLSLNSTWEEIEPLLQDDERYQRIEDPRAREMEFKRYVSDQRSQAKRQLKKLLKETVTLTNATSGKEYEKNMALLRKDWRWMRMGVVREEREKIFLEYISGLPDAIASLRFEEEK